MTLFVADVSEHQNGLDLLRASGTAGLDGFILRTSDGAHRDLVFASHYEDAVRTGLPIAAYHYMRNPSEPLNGASISEQVSAIAEILGGRDLGVWLDCETTYGLDVSHIRGVRDGLRARGIRVLGIYTGVSYWETQVTPSEPLMSEFGEAWVASYYRYSLASAQELYPGDDHRTWSYPLGWSAPVLWQFASTLRVPGWPKGIDVSAFRGTTEELRALFDGKEITPPTTKEPAMTYPEELTLDQLAGPGRNDLGMHDFSGWPQLGGRTLVDAVAAIGEKLGVDGFAVANGELKQ